MADDDQDDVPSLCNCSALRRASRRISQRYDNELAPAGLKTSQYSLLAELGRRKSGLPTMNELADAMAMDRSTLGHNLQPLLRDGWVKLAASASDKRRRQVVLTQRGTDKLAEARKLWKRAQDAFENEFGAGEAKALRKVLFAIAGEAP